MNEKEEWIDIEGYEGIYKISSLGKVKSLKRNTSGTNTNSDSIMKQKLSRHGYYRVGLSKSSKVKWFLVHRLIAKAFIPNPNNYPCINHINSKREDNSIKNLEWCSYSKNSKHSFDTNGRKNVNRLLTEEDVLLIRNQVNIYNVSQKQIAEKYNVSKSVINQIIKNKTYKSV